MPREKSGSLLPCFYRRFKNMVSKISEALKRYFVEYETMLNHEFIHPKTKENTTFRKCFRLQAENLASTIQNDSPYIPFILEI